MITNYTSLKSVIYDVSLMLDERYYNERDINEYALKALFDLRADLLLQEKATVIEVVDHKAVLPEDLKYLLMIAYYDNGMYQPLQLNSSPFFNDKCNDDLKICTNCKHTFSVNSDLIITTTLKEGDIYVAYKAYPCDENGDIVIPDNEDLKEAIFNFILYKYWQKKYNMMEDGAETRMRFYLSMWDTLSKKAVGNLNMPSLSELENLKNQFNALRPRGNSFSNLFIGLSNKEHANY